jgi:hypothetical protein
MYYLHTHKNVAKLLKNSLAKHVTGRLVSLCWTVEIFILKYHNQSSLMILVKLLTAQLEH